MQNPARTRFWDEFQKRTRPDRTGPDRLLSKPRTGPDQFGYILLIVDAKNLIFKQQKWFVSKRNYTKNVILTQKRYFYTENKILTQKTWFRRKKHDFDSNNVILAQKKLFLAQWSAPSQQIGLLLGMIWTCFGYVFQLSVVSFWWEIL